MEIASLHFDQPGNSDLGREMAAAHGVPIFDVMIDALTLGGDQLAVDGVLSICEHGKYAWNEKEQYLYPRRHFMEQICGVMAVSGRAVPVFNDKHLSWRWQDARWSVRPAPASSGRRSWPARRYRCCGATPGSSTTATICAKR